MAHLWITGDAGSWGLRPIAGEGCVVRSFSEGLVFNDHEGASRPGPAEVVLLPAGLSVPWVLLAGRAIDVRVNGAALVLGIRALRDKDDVSIAGHRLFFSTEQLATVTTYPGAEQPAFCPRCKQRLERGDPAVKCPHCHAWHHESEKYPCWTYDATCALCQQQPTALDAGYSWTPEEL